MSSVVFSQIQTSSGALIGHATLNKPQALNALSLEMVRLLLPQLQAWQKDDKVVAVLLDSEGDKAFCAGGDVVALHSAMRDTELGVPADVQTFFCEEYQLDYLIHRFNKPFIVWGSGIVMGGGMGLMAGASHRIVTETTRMAMPEITIGLYPDVGFSYMLNRMPEGVGLFLGLTGASINASDALHIGLADYAMVASGRDNFVQALQQADWAQTDAHSLLHSLCQQFDTPRDMPQGFVEPHQSQIQRATQASNLEAVVAQILTLDSSDDKWLARAQKGLAAGSPISANLVWQQLQRCSDMSLAACFQQELIMSCRCAELGEFEEGVRALLIDKDNQPKWQFDSVATVPESVIEHYFKSPWQQHPLAHLD